MSPLQTLLDKLKHLNTLDPDHLPVVPLAAFFEGNNDEHSIAVNQWGYGRPPIRELYTRLVTIAARPEVEGIYVGLHDDWGIALEEHGTWPYAENIHILTRAEEATVESWLQGLHYDAVIQGWPYGQHAAAPTPSPGYYVQTVCWD